MEKIKLTNEIVSKLGKIGRPPKVTISKSVICFNASAAYRLSLKLGDHFSFEVDDYKLYLVMGGDFVIKSKIEKTDTLKAHVSGILTTIKHYTNTNTQGTIRYSIGAFKQGRRELIPIMTEKVK